MAARRPRRRLTDRQAIALAVAAVLTAVAACLPLALVDLGPPPRRESAIRPVTP